MHSNNRPKLGHCGSNCPQYASGQNPVHGGGGVVGISQEQKH